MCYKENKLEAVAKIMNGNSSQDSNIEISKEKKEKGLYERTEECKVLLTEDNKMLLND